LPVTREFGFRDEFAQELPPVLGSVASLLIETLALDTLRREIAPFGVQVVVVEPGAVNTGLAGRAIAAAHELVSTMTPEQRQRYGGLVQAITAQAASHTESGLPADAAAKVIAKAVTARKPRTRYTVGRDAALITLLARILPDRILDRVLAAALRPLLHQGEQKVPRPRYRSPVSPRLSPARPAASVPKSRPPSRRLSVRFAAPACRKQTEN
jgi:hypothetical protein